MSIEWHMQVTPEMLVAVEILRDELDASYGTKWKWYSMGDPLVAMANQRLTEANLAIPGL